MKQWYVEDAGGGCRAFSEIVVLVSEEPREIYWSAIPLTWSNNFSLEEIVCQQVLDLMARAGVSKKDHLFVCSGNIFSGFHRWLNEHHYHWETVKMDGLAHEVAENIFSAQINEAGFPLDIQLVDRNYRNFYQAIESWVMENPARHCYLKDRQVRQKPVETRYVIKSNGSRTQKCDQCRGKIMPFTPVVEYRHRENGKRIRRFYHLSCSPVEPLKNRLSEHTVCRHNENVTGVLTGVRTGARCAVCNELMQPGETAFYGYQAGKLFCGHPGCLDGASPDPGPVRHPEASNA
ncbi:MAG: hypothetical protein AB1815_03390 [Bacillota bacterium]|jgi:hypothetical protein